MRQWGDVRGDRRVVRATRFLGYARNDMWGKGMGPRPPSSRGQDLDARTTGGVFSRGQALRGENGGERLRMKEGENGRRGTGDY